MTTEASKHPVDDLLDDIEVRIEALEKIFKEDLNEGVARARALHVNYLRNLCSVVSELLKKGATPAGIT